MSLLVFFSDNDMVESELQSGLSYCVSWAIIPCMSDTTLIQRARLPAVGTSVTQEQPVSVQTDILEKKILRKTFCCLDLDVVVPVIFTRHVQLVSHLPKVFQRSDLSIFAL